MVRIKLIFLCLMLLLAVSILSAQPAWLCANTAGGTGWDYGSDIACDSWGNIYVTGMIEGSAIFDGVTLTGYGGRDILIAKADPYGNWLWQLNAGGRFP